MLRLEKFPIIFISVLALFLRIYRLNDLFFFDYDQQVPAQSAYDFFVNNKISFIGQELSFQGFFLGPVHNWFQFIPYGLCNLSVDCVSYFFVLLSVATVPVLYFVTREVLDKKTALIASLIYSVSFAQISFERAINSNYFLFLSSILLIYCMHKYFREKNIFLIIGSFISGLAVVNFNPLFIFSYIAFLATGLFRQNKKILAIVLGFLAFFINFLPLVMFNFRHSNILLGNFKKFLDRGFSESVSLLDKLDFLTLKVMVPFLTNYLFGNTNVVLVVVTIVLLTMGTYLIIKSKVCSLLFLPLVPFSVLAGLFMYSGQIPDYYFQQTLIATILIIALTLKRNFLVFMIFLSIITFFNFNKVLTVQNPISYGVKKKAVAYILNESKGDSFKVYYDVPLGFNTGFEQLFRNKRTVPRDDGQNLFIFYIAEPQHVDFSRYYLDYHSNQISIEKFSNLLYIISIK